MSEAMLLADEILLREDIPNQKKISKLRFLFNRWGGQLYNKINQYAPESYGIDKLKDEEIFSEENIDDIFAWILVNNNIITPLENTVLSYLIQWVGKYEIARLMKTTYYNIRDIVDILSLKIKRFISEQDENADDS